MPFVRTSWWVALLAVASILGYIVLSYHALFGPYGPGLGVEDSGGYVVVREVEAGEAAARAGIALNDRLLAVNGQPVATVVDWLALRMNFVPDHPVAVHLERNSQPLDLMMTMRGTAWRVLSPTARVTEIIFLLSKLITLVVGLLIIFSRPRDFVARLGGWFLVSMATVFEAFPYSLSSSLRALPFIITLPVMLVYVSAAIRTPLMFMFFALFPQHLVKKSWIWVWLLACPAISTPYSLYLLARTIYDPAHVTSLVKPWVLPAFGAQSTVYMVAGMVVLLVNYWRIDNITERRKLRVLIIGSVIGLASYLPRVLLTSFLEFRPESKAWLPSAAFDLVTTAGYLAFPLSFAYCILRHRLFDIRIIIRRGLQYAFARRSLLSIPPLVAGLLLLDLVLHGREPLLNILEARGWLYATIAALAGLAYFRRQAWLSALDRRFFRDRYDGQKLLHDIADEIRDSANIEQVAPAVVARITGALHAQFCALISRGPSDSVYRTVAAAPVQVLYAELRSTNKLIPLVRVFGKPFPVLLAESGWFGQQLPQEDKDFLRDAQIDLIVPVDLTQGQTEVLLVLGSKRSEEPYSTEDISLLETIASSMALLLARGPAGLSHAVFEECPRCGNCYDTGTTRCPTDNLTLTLIPNSRLLADRYRLDGRLGQGGMGKVYRATDISLDRKVAVKMIREELLSDPSALDRFSRECRVAGSLSHPNLVAVHDFGVDSAQRAFLVMELLEGITLRKEMQLHSRLAPARILQVFEPLCAGLEAAHSRGLVHRDLKPENIFLVRASAPEVVKITDFGIAKFLPRVADETSDTFTGVPLGTLRYMSPEQLRAGALSHSWDLWALSVIAYEALCGIHPFATAEVATLPGAILAGDVTPLKSYIPEAPARWQEFFILALALQTEARPDSVASFWTALNTALAPA
jgi:tRNA A-37 threonylcarbamoyl transferase component Bud32